MSDKDSLRKKAKEAWIKTIKKENDKKPSDKKMAALGVRG